MVKNKIVIITGAANGIGRACAERFAKEGAIVTVADVDDGIGQNLADTLKINHTDARFMHCDVRIKEDIEHLIDSTHTDFGRIDTVIANAAIVHNCDVLDLEEKDFDNVISINLKGVFLTGQLAAKKMLAQAPDEFGQRGAIINMSSINAILAIPSVTPYIISKGGVNQWTKCLAIRLAAEGIRVNGIGPGSINTEMFKSIANNKQKLRDVLSRTPMQRAGDPDEIAKVAVFLASNYASYITGETIYADGGRLGLNYMVPVADDA